MLSLETYGLHVVRAPASLRQQTGFAAPPARYVSALATGSDRSPTPTLTSCWQHMLQLQLVTRHQ